MNYELETQSKVTQNIFLVSRPISNGVTLRQLPHTQILHVIFSSFLKIHQIFFCIFKEKKMNWALFFNFHIPKYFTQTSNKLPQLLNLKRTPKHSRGIDPWSSHTAHFSRSFRLSFLLVENCIII